jgi:hypothetical protein
VRGEDQIDHDDCALTFMLPVIVAVRSELRSKGLDRLQCCWHVRYQFCGLSAEITVYAENEADAGEGDRPTSPAGSEK